MIRRRPLVPHPPALQLWCKQCRTLGSAVHGDVPKCQQAPCTPLFLSCGHRSRADTSRPISMAKSETSPEARLGDRGCHRTSGLFHLGIILLRVLMNSGYSVYVGLSPCHGQNQPRGQEAAGRVTRRKDFITGGSSGH